MVLNCILFCIFNAPEKQGLSRFESDLLTQRTSASIDSIPVEKPH